MEEKKEWFESWFDSPYHSSLYQKRDTEEARLFVNNLMRELKIPAESKILDIACGDGRHAEYLQQHNNEVIGIDLSESRIKIAKNKETQHLHFYQQDMRNVFRSNYFDYAFNFFTSFGYFKHYRDNVIAAEAFGKALKPSGVLIIDYMNVAVIKASLKSTDLIMQNGITFNIRRKFEDNKVIKEIDFTDTAGHPQHFEEIVSGFDLQSFLEIFKTSNLTLVKTYGDYHLNAFDIDTSPRLIMQFAKGNP